MHSYWLHASWSNTLSPRWGWYRSVVSHGTVCDPSHCWRKDLVWVCWIYCHRRKQQSQGSHYLSDTVLWKTPSNGSHLSQRICWIPRINCAIIWTSPHCRRHEYSCGRPRWCRRYKVFRSPGVHGANTTCDYTNSPFWTHFRLDHYTGPGWPCSDLPISDSFLSDHCTVLSELTLRMPATTVTEVCYRKTKAIDIESFKDDLRKSRLCQDPPDALTDLVSCYGSTMTSLLDKHAPLQRKTITVRPRVHWFNNEITEAKRLRRRNERIWRRTGLESDRVKFIEARNHTNHVMEQARRVTIISILLVKTIVIRESFSRRPVHC